MIRNTSAWGWANGRVSFWLLRATVLLMLRPFGVALFFNAVPFATRSFDSSRPFEVALFYNAVPFKDADTAARSFERPIKNAGSIRSVLRPLDTDASRSFHTLGAAVPPFGAGEPLYVRSNRRSIHPNRLLLPGNHLL